MIRITSGKVLLLLALCLMTSLKVSAQKQKKFDEAIAKGWTETKGYAYAERVIGEARKSQFTTKALQMGYVITEFATNFVYFCKTTEKEKLDYEKENAQFVKEYEKFHTGKQISLSNFKSTGTAYLYFTFSNADYGYEHSRLLLKCQNTKWTGQLKNGFLEGEGDGVCEINARGGLYRYAFSGSFHDGFVEKGTFWYYRAPQDRVNKVDVEIMPFSEGMSFMKDNKDKKWTYTLIDEDGNSVVSRPYSVVSRPYKMLSAVKQHFRDGKAIVTMYDTYDKISTDIVINKKGEIIGVGDGVQLS